MTQRLISCAFCKHYRSRGRCAAFPEGIPLIVKQGRSTHRLPMEGDNGIQWEPIEGFENVLDHLDVEKEPFPPTAMGN